MAYNAQTVFRMNKLCKTGVLFSPYECFFKFAAIFPEDSAVCETATTTYFNTAARTIILLYYIGVLVCAYNNIVIIILLRARR